MRFKSFTYVLLPLSIVALLLQFSIIPFAIIPIMLTAASVLTILFCMERSISTDGISQTLLLVLVSLHIPALLLVLGIIPFAFIPIMITSAASTLTILFAFQCLIDYINAKRECDGTPLELSARDDRAETYILADLAKTLHITAATKTEDMIKALKVLGITQSHGEISPREINTAYKKASLQNHPDKGGRTEMFQVIDDAKRKLIEGIELKQDLLEIAQGLDLAKSIESMVCLSKGKKDLRERLGKLKIDNTQFRKEIINSLIGLISIIKCIAYGKNTDNTTEIKNFKEQAKHLKEEVIYLQEEQAELEPTQAAELEPTQTAEINPQIAMAADKFTGESSSSTPLPDSSMFANN